MPSKPSGADGGDVGGYHDVLERKKYHEVEYWCRQLTQCPPSLAIHNHLLFIGSRILLSSVLFRQRKLEEARSEHQIVHQLVLSSTLVDELFVEWSLFVGGSIACFLHEDKDSESWFRQLAQLTLKTYGPRSSDTILYLQRLAKAMLRQCKYSESEELLWILIDLAKTSF
jgi:hypothetical protein